MTALSSSQETFLTTITSVIMAEYSNLLILQIRKGLVDGDIISLKIGFGYRDSNPSIVADIEIPGFLCTIGLWMDSKTADISVFSSTTGDSFYEYHGEFQDLDEATEYVAKTFATLSNTQKVIPL